MVTPAIRTDGPGKRYGKVDALRDLSLQMHEARKAGQTVFLSSHILSEVEAQRRSNP